MKHAIWLLAGVWVFSALAHPVTTSHAKKHLAPAAEPVVVDAPVRRSGLARDDYFIVTPKGFSDARIIPA